MATENKKAPTGDEKSKIQTEDPSLPSHPDHPEHHSWLQKIKEELGGIIHNENIDFPLSGGEEDE